MNFALWNENIHDKCMGYLNKYSDTSMFLLQNIEEHGYRRGGHQNSGDFYVMLENGSIKGVFVLANRGNVLFQLDEDIESQKIVEFIINNESIVVTGILGENSRAVEMWELFQKLNNKLEETFKSCEILYSLKPLVNEFPDISHAKYFEKEDFDIYLEFTKGFYRDQNLPDNSTDDEYRERFQFKVEHKHVWCFEENEELVSMCSLNAKYKKIVQVGGVYTPSKYRSKGYSKKCMRKLIHDCIKIHNVEKIILFTASNNFPAQKVYESLGFQRIGHYGMYFGELNNSN